MWNTFPDRVLIEARDASLQLEQLAVNDLKTNINGYLEPNWRTRRMVDDWASYVANNGRMDESQFWNFRAAFSETKGLSSAVFARVLATHTREANYNLSETMFGGDLANGKSAASTEEPVNGQHDLNLTGARWAKAVNSAVQHLEKHAWWKCDKLVPSEIVDSLKQRLFKQIEAEHPGKLDPILNRAEDAELQLKVHSHETSRIEEFYKISSDPLLLAIAQKYIGVPPIFTSPIALLNSNAKPKDAKALSEAAQLYHHDNQRLKFVKLFVYLTDVDEDSGPHTLISGTHRERPDSFWGDGRYSDQAITSARLDGKVTKVTGKAGTVFLVDTSCLHKGAHPEKTCRLMAQVQYSNSLFGKPFPASVHKVEMAATSKAASVQEVADLVRTYAAKAGVRFMQNYI